VELGRNAKEKVKIARDTVDKFVSEGRVIYGITTGFGKFSDVVISQEETNDLQRNLIISHACGVGEPFSEDIVRAMILLRINSLVKGHSGIRPITLDKLVELLNKRVHPVIPEQGSLGASGDLAPLSHMVLTILGLGEAFYNGVKMESSKALELAGIEPLPFITSKEGLALINGTQAMTSVGTLAIYDAMNLSKIADIAGALSLEALTGIRCALDPRVHEIRGHSGQIDTAKNLLKLIENSKMVTNQGELRTQDAYVLRCMPQIHGATKDALRFIKDRIEIEINAVTDNPLIFPDTEEAISAGNFHGQPMALPLDYLGIAVSELANVSERRLERLVNPALSNGLPAFLTKHGGVHSGFMIVQYSAASLVSENKVLAHPASVDSIPSSANQEDHVSMGTIASRKARDIIKNARNVIAMEILGACQGIDLRDESFLGKGTDIAYTYVREHINFIDKDVVMYKNIHKCSDLISDDEIISRVEKVTGELL
jgi:histidine ammonia-lyase